MNDRERIDELRKKLQSCNRRTCNIRNADGGYVLKPCFNCRLILIEMKRIQDHF